MRTTIQRVQYASVTINKQVKSKIADGLLVLIGIEDNDTEEDLQWLAKKIVNLRIFNDAQGKMNLSIKDINGEILLISQFTLFASTKKGNRPSFLQSAKPEKAIPIYEQFIKILSSQIKTKTGVFGADMKIELLNDGPVTINIDSKNKY